MANYRDQSPIKVNLKKARYGCSNYSDDSDIGNGIGIEDFPIADLDNFTK